MREFAALYTAIDETNKTSEKVAAMERYFRSAPPADAAWAVHFLIGRRPKRLVISTKMQVWATELAGIPMWLFGECYDSVGDLGEVIAAILPNEGREAEGAAERSLEHWVTERLLALAGMDEEEQRLALTRAWLELGRQERFVFNKLITGAFRVGVSQDLVVRALSQASSVPATVIAHRLMGDWQPSAAFYEWLMGKETSDADLSRPYPFCLAHPLQDPPESLGDPSEWHIEWKWDGIRAQLIHRRGQVFAWSRGEDLITERFPEIREICEALPQGTVIDGEILAWAGGRPLPFLELQRRIGRKNLSKKILAEVPVVLIAFDLLEHEGEDWRERPFRERRAALERLVEGVNARHLAERLTDLLPEPGASKVDLRLATDRPHEPAGEPATVEASSRLLLSAQVVPRDWADLAARREEARLLGVEGLMLKRLDLPYAVGRKKGLWWKWKIDPFSVDAVLIYAQRGSGKRASLYTDYTFGVWSGGKLVPFAKAYSGLSDEEIRRVDSWVRRNTLEKYGPVRTVKPELVMELGFEAIQLSARHKSGVAVRFPRILKWRHDKRPEDADSLESVKELLREYGR